MVAFFSWYSIPPLITYIEHDLGISASKVYDSNVVAVAATVGKLSFPVFSACKAQYIWIVARSVVGPFCERFGPRRVMAGLLLAGSIPCAMTGLVRNADGLIALRSVSSILAH